MRPDLISVFRLLLLLVKTPILFHNSNSTISNEFVRQLAGQVGDTTCLVNLNLPEGLQLAKEVQKIESHHLHLLSFTNDLELIESTLIKIANRKTPLRFYMPLEPIDDSYKLARVVRYIFDRRNSDLYLLRSGNGTNYINKISTSSLNMDKGKKLWLDTAHIDNFNRNAQWVRFQWNYPKHDKAFEYDRWLDVVLNQIEESKTDLRRVIPKLPKEQLEALCGTDYLPMNDPESYLNEFHNECGFAIVLLVIISLVVLSEYVDTFGCRGNRLTILCTTCLAIYLSTYLLCGYQYRYCSLIHILTRDLCLSLAAARTLLIIIRLCQIEDYNCRMIFHMLIYVLGAICVDLLFLAGLVLHLQSLFNLTSSFQYPFLIDSIMLSCYEIIIYIYDLEYPMIAGLDSSPIVSYITAYLKSKLQTIKIVTQTIRQPQIEATPPVSIVVVNEV